MNGMLNIVMVVATILVAVMTYQAKFKARTLELDIRVLHKKNQNLKTDLSVLRAEQSYLSRPARIERLAYKFLSLSPTVPNRSLSSDLLLSQRLELESKQSAMLVLRAMKRKERERQTEANALALKQQGDQQNSSFSAVLPKTRTKLEGRASLNAQPAQAIQDRTVKRSALTVGAKTESSRQNADDNAGLPSKVLPPKVTSKKPKKPKWTYYGGIGDDD